MVRGRLALGDERHDEWYTDLRPGLGKLNQRIGKRAPTIEWDNGLFTLRATHPDYVVQQKR